MKNTSLLNLVYVVVALFFVGCSSVSKETYPRSAGFPEVRTLPQTEAVSCDSYLRYPYRVALKDGLAVILDLHRRSASSTHLPIRIGSMSLIRQAGRRS